MNAGPTTVDGIPPSCGGYTPDWGKPYGFWKTLGFGVVVYIVTSYCTWMVVNVYQLLVVQATPDIYISAISSPRELQILTIGRYWGLSSCVKSILGIALLGLVIIGSDAPLRSYVGAGKLRTRQIAAFLLVTIVLSFAWRPIASLTGESVDGDFWTDVYRNSRPVVALWLGVGILGPVFEEFFYRGFLFIGIRGTKLGSGGAVFLTSVLFAFSHYQYGKMGVAWILVVGLLLGVARQYSGTVKLPMVLHVTYNLIFLTITRTVP